MRSQSFFTPRGAISTADDEVAEEAATFIEAPPDDAAAPLADDDATGDAAGDCACC